jgi:hypothetical protein
MVPTCLLQGLGNQCTGLGVQGAGRFIQEQHLPKSKIEKIRTSRWSEQQTQLCQHISTNINMYQHISTYIYIYIPHIYIYYTYIYIYYTYIYIIYQYISYNNPKTMTNTTHTNIQTSKKMEP